MTVSLRLFQVERGLTQRQRRREYDDRDNQTDDGIEVILEAPISQPNYQAGRDDPDVA